MHTHNDGVIDIDRRLRSILDGLDEELQLAYVGAAMAAQCGLPGPGVLIFLMIRRKWLPLVIFWAPALNVNSVYLFIVEAASALNKPAIIVWPGKLHIVVDNYGFSFFGPNYRCHDVTLCEFSLGVRMVGAEFFGEMLIDADRVRRGRGNVVEGVTAVYVHPANHGSQLVGGVLVAVVLNEILGRPAVHAGPAIEEPVVNTIVGVGAVTMRDFAE